MVYSLLSKSIYYCHGYLKTLAAPLPTRTRNALFRGPTNLDPPSPPELPRGSTPSRFDLESLPDLQNLFRGTEKAPIIITDEGTKSQGEDIKLEPWDNTVETVTSLITTPPTSVVQARLSPSLETSMDGVEGNWSRQGNSPRLRPKASLRASAKLRDRSQRRDRDRRSRSRGVGRKRA